MSLKNILLLSCFISTIYGQKLMDENICGIDLKFEQEFWSLKYTNQEVNDTFSKDEFFSFQVPKNVTECKFRTSSNYLSGTFSNRTVTIKPTNEFSQIEYQLDSSSIRNVELNIDLDLQCGENYGENTEFTFIQPINDTNNNKPFFNRKTYVYRFGMPINAGADLTQLLEIYAVDIDLSNDKIEFSIEPEGDLKITLAKTDYSTKKIHYAKLETMRQIESDFNTEYIITATDMGTPPSTATATVKLIIDP